MVARRHAFAPFERVIGMRGHAQRAFGGGGRRQQEDAQPSVAHLSRCKMPECKMPVLPPSVTRWAALRRLAVLVQATADRVRTSERSRTRSSTPLAPAFHAAQAPTVCGCTRTHKTQNAPQTHARRCANKTVTIWGTKRGQGVSCEKARRRASSPLGLNVTPRSPRARRPPRAAARPRAARDTTARTSATRLPFPSNSRRAPPGA